MQQAQVHPEGGGRGRVKGCLPASQVCGSEARRQEVLASPCPLQCSLTCRLQEQQDLDQLCISLPLLPSCSYSPPYQPTTVQVNSILHTAVQNVICRFYEFFSILSAPSCPPQFSLTSSLSSHDTQTVPGCLYLPGDSYSYTSGNRCRAKIN